MGIQTLSEHFLMACWASAEKQGNPSLKALEGGLTVGTILFADPAIKHKMEIFLDFAFPLHRNVMLAV